jgi:hypothetical protein
VVLFQLGRHLWFTFELGFLFYWGMEDAQEKPDPSYSCLHKLRWIKPPPLKVYEKGKGLIEIQCQWYWFAMARGKKRIALCKRKHRLVNPPNSPCCKTTWLNISSSLDICREWNANQLGGLLYSSLRGWFGSPFPAVQTRSLVSNLHSSYTSWWPLILIRQRKNVNRSGISSPSFRYDVVEQPSGHQISDYTTPMGEHKWIGTTG